MASIQKKPDGKFAVRWRDRSGKQVWRTCPDHRTAKQLAREIEQTLALGRDWSPAEPDGVVALDQLVIAYLDYKRQQLAPRTMRKYVEYLTVFQRFLAQHTGQPRQEPSVLTRSLLTAYYAWLRLPENGLHGRGRSLATTQKVVEVVQLFWKWAYNQEQWPTVPPPRRSRCAARPRATCARRTGPSSTPASTP